MSKTCFLCGERKTYNYKVYHVASINRVNGVVVCNECIKKLGDDIKVEEAIINKIFKE